MQAEVWIASISLRNHDACRKPGDDYRHVLLGYVLGIEHFEKHSKKQRRLVSFSFRTAHAGIPTPARKMEVGMMGKFPSRHYSNVTPLDNLWGFAMISEAMALAASNLIYNAVRREVRDQLLV